MAPPVRPRYAQPVAGVLPDGAARADGAPARGEAPDVPERVEFRVLGPLEVAVDGKLVAVGGTKPRALLVRLLLDAGRTVTAERLVDDLWGDEPPETARKMVQVYVSRLRKLLPEGSLQTRAPGYQLTVPDGALDLERFEVLRAAGRAALEQGRHEEAARELRRALALWRGPALAGLEEPFAAAETARLEGLRSAALEERIQADLELGRVADVVSELEALVALHPLRERLRAQLMLALYRAGRQAEALATFQEARRVLADDLGIDPSQELRELELRILRHDPGLERRQHRLPPATPVPGPTLGAAVAATPPRVRYTRSGEVSIAYQIVGDGPVDLVLVHGWVCTFQPGWEDEQIAGFYRRLAAIGRLILFDKRGTGLSDRVWPDRLPDLETRMDDVRAVMDAAGSEQAVLIGVSEGGPMSLLFAATHPERTAGLVLLGTFARLMWAHDYPIGLREEEMRRRLALAESDDWAQAVTREWLGRVEPAIPADSERFAWYSSYVMRGASPAGARALRLMNAEIDVRHVLPSIGVPTLVAYRSGEWFASGSRYLGERLHDAKVAELPGDDHLPWEGDQDALLGEIERFAAGIQEEVHPDRVLVTLLVTDLVGSTRTAASLGDRAWRDLVERHYDVLRAQLARFRGREIDSAGDGILAVFDGPARAVRCALAMTRRVEPLGLELRAGVHTGEVERAGPAVRGLAVHVAARIASEAAPGQVLVSQMVKDLVAGSGLAFDDCGGHSLSGVPGEWRLLSARSGGEAVDAAASL
jgi:DNA-binding SARP family transcriptional activator/pimeloyl-ACP methyl ester carboxylesterase